MEKILIVTDVMDMERANAFGEPEKFKFTQNFCTAISAGGRTETGESVRVEEKSKDCNPGLVAKLTAEVCEKWPNKPYHILQLDCRLDDKGARIPRGCQMIGDVTGPTYCGEKAKTHAREEADLNADRLAATENQKKRTIENTNLAIVGQKTRVFPYSQGPFKQGKTNVCSAMSGAGALGQWIREDRAAFFCDDDMVESLRLSFCAKWPGKLFNVVKLECGLDASGVLDPKACSILGDLSGPLVCPMGGA
jgi:hypothetical protein